MILRKEIVLLIMGVDYITFLDELSKNTIKIKEDCNCIEIYGEKINFDFKGWYYRRVDLEKTFEKIYEYHCSEGKTFKDVYSYEEFKFLFYDEFLEIVKEEIEKIENNIKTIIENEIYKRIKELLILGLCFEVCLDEKEEIKKLIVRFGNRTCKKMGNYIREITREIPKKVIEGENYTICANISKDEEIEITIKNKDKIDKVKIILIS